MRFRRKHFEMGAALGLVGVLVVVGVIAFESAQQAGQAAPTPHAAFDVASKLTSIGAGTCAAQLDAAAAGTMGGVAASNVLSNWAKAAIDRRMTSVSIGQKYPAGGVVPYAATTIVAAPNPLGVCDTVTVQVIPSPLSCEEIRVKKAARSKLIGDLAGVPVMQDTDGETLLVPTAANTCVLVGVRTAFAK